jgi:hypothetical protein
MTLAQWKPTAWRLVVRLVPQARVLADQMVELAVHPHSAVQLLKQLLLTAEAVATGLNYPEPLLAAAGVLASYLLAAWAEPGPMVRPEPMAALSVMPIILSCMVVPVVPRQVQQVPLAAAVAMPPTMARAAADLAAAKQAEALTALAMKAGKARI